jgi:hypothetical protein
VLQVPPPNLEREQRGELNVFPCADRAAYFCVGLVLIVRFYPYAHCFVGIAGMPFPGLCSTGQGGVLVL